MSDPLPMRTTFPVQLLIVLLFPSPFPSILCAMSTTPRYVFTLTALTLATLYPLLHNVTETGLRMSPGTTH